MLFFRAELAQRPGAGRSESRRGQCITGRCVSTQPGAKTLPSRIRQVLCVPRNGQEDASGTRQGHEQGASYSNPAGEREHCGRTLSRPCGGRNFGSVPRLSFNPADIRGSRSPATAAADRTPRAAATPSGVRSSAVIGPEGRRQAAAAPHVRGRRVRAGRPRRGSVWRHAAEPRVRPGRGPGRDPDRRTEGCDACWHPGRAWMILCIRSAHSVTAGR